MMTKIFASWNNFALVLMCCQRQPYWPFLVMKPVTLDWRGRNANEPSYLRIALWTEKNYWESNPECLVCRLFTNIQINTGNQTCTRPEVFVISYLLFCSDFNWHFFWEDKSNVRPSKSKVADENLPLWASFFSSATSILEGMYWIFLIQKKIAKQKQVKITNMILQRP